MLWTIFKFFVISVFRNSGIPECRDNGTLLFQERGAHGREGVNEDTVFEALASVHNVRNLHQHIASLYNLGLAIDGELEFATLDVGDLHVRMTMEFAL